MLRRLEPGVRVIREDQPAALDAIDQLLRYRGADRRTSPAPAETARGLHECLAHVRRAVHNDGAIAGLIVEALVQTVEAQRVAVLADVGGVGLEQPEAGAMRFRLIAELGRH